MPERLRKTLKQVSRSELERHVAENLPSFTEEEALAVLEHPHCTASLCQAVARNARLVGFYSVRLRLVQHRQTPQSHAVRFVHYLYWPDLVRLSVDVTVAPAVRRAVDTQLLLKVDKLTLGERVSVARRCSDALIKTLLFDHDPKVFAALLVNQLVKEDHLLLLAASPDASAEKLAILSADRKWSYRYAIRKALVTNPRTPRAVAASHLRHLTVHDLRQIYLRPDTSVYVKRCIEALRTRQTGVQSAR